MPDSAVRDRMATLARQNWVETTRYCERCGAALERLDGHAVCSDCGGNVFPRIDPSVIVAVLDATDRLFLAHNALWEAGRVSLLAGFVEAGESCENALYREVVEESGLVISAYRYLGSQPWPYPRSLMLGYVARSGGEATVDGREITWGDWYSRERLRALVADATVGLPREGSIARAIIDAWLAGELPAPEG